MQLRLSRFEKEKTQMLNRPETENKKDVRAVTAFALAVLCAGDPLLDEGPPPP